MSLPQGPPLRATLTLGTQDEGRPMKPMGAVGAPNHYHTHPPCPRATVVGEVRSDEKACGRYGRSEGLCLAAGPPSC